MVALPSGPLVSVEWLAANMRDVRIVDVRGEVRPVGEPNRYRPKRAAYDEGHITGAFFVDWTRDIVNVNDPVPVQIAKPEHFASTMSSIGIGDGTPVIAYDDYRSAFASRFAWALRYHGHDDVRVLDGGFAAWVKGGHPTSTHPPRPTTAKFTPRIRPELRRTAQDVEAAQGTILLLDARMREQFDGKVSAASRTGHIPHARSVPYPDFFEEDGRYKSPEAIAKILAAAGVDPKDTRPIVAYCNAGVTACTVRNALALVGRDDVAIYDGSWNEWGNDSARPIEGSG